MSEIQVSELAIYPVKSCAQISLQSATIDLFGLTGDRRWMIVDDNGHMLTQRKLSRMCLIQPVLFETGLILKATNVASLRIVNPLGTSFIPVTVWHDTCQALDAGDEAAIWLSNFLNIKCRLVYFPDNEVRQVDMEYAHKGDKTAFSDGFPILLISQASLDDLNSRLIVPIEMKRFRPNLVVKGCDAFAEDRWKKIRIGELNFRLVKSCSRCVIPNINPETAERGNEPIQTLINYRKQDNKIYFGQNIIAEGVGGMLKLGLPVEVLG